MSVAEQRHEGERRVWSSERGALTFIRMVNGVALVVCDGKLDEAAAAAWTEHFAWVIGDGQVVAFLDGASVTFPSGSFISAVTASMTAVRPRLGLLKVLVGGGLIEMVAKTANLTLGGILDITRDRAQFEAELERRLG